MNTHDIDIELPPLPEPFVGLQHNSGWNTYEQVVSSAIGEPHVISVFIEGQMQAYAIAAIEADRQANKALLPYMPETIAVLKATGCNESLVTDIEKAMRGKADRQARGEPVGSLSRSADESIKFTPFVDLHVTDGMLVYTVPQPSVEGVCQNHPQQTPDKDIPEDFVDELAQEIRRVDGNHSLGAAALAERLVPFLSRTLFEAAPEVKDK